MTSTSVTVSSRTPIAHVEQMISGCGVSGVRAGGESEAQHPPLLITRRGISVITEYIEVERCGILDHSLSGLMTTILAEAATNHAGR